MARVTVAAALAAPLLVLAPSCALSPAGPGGVEPEGLTAISGSPHTIQWEGYVYVAEGAPDDAVRDAIRRQVKSALGALREVDVGIEDREARHNLDPSSWTRSSWTVVEASGARRRVDRVTYRYVDRALVGTGVTGPLELTLLFGDYASRAAELVPICSDDAAADPGSLWYHFAPSRAACRRAVASEAAAIAAATEALGEPSAELPAVEADRRFLTVRAALTPHGDPPDYYPELDRIFDLGGEGDGPIVAYAFFGVDADVRSPSDHGLREALRFQRVIRAELPGLELALVRPGAGLLDYAVGGRAIPGVTFDDVERWVLEGRGFPAEVGSDPALRAELLAEVVERYAERWVVWELPVTVEADGLTVERTIEVRTFYGEEDGSARARDRARSRYVEAFTEGTVFAYTGHSHFGHGPLDPERWGSWAFPDRYQVMLVNSCLSYNYYDADFLEMHPGGTASLDVVVNGLPAYWTGMGEATAHYVVGLLDGRARSYREVLDSMRVDLSFERGYDPMRAVNGELDNVYDPTERPIAVTPRPDDGDWRRTVVLIAAETRPGQDLLLRGGLDHGAALDLLGLTCTAESLECAVPIRHLNHRNPTTADWKGGDRHLDWYGAEERQPRGVAGTPADWTTDEWPAVWGLPRTVAVDGFGAEELNDLGPHYWMLDVEMDCSRTLDGWFELKAYVAGGQGWEPDVAQPGAPYRSANHFARCGGLSVFRFGEDEADLRPLD